jgi:hypothetical protein
MRQTEPRLLCPCAVARLSGEPPQSEAYGCACVGPQPIREADGVQWFAAIVPRSAGPDTPVAERLARVCVERPPNLTLTEWLREIRRVAEEVLAVALSERMCRECAGGEVASVPQDEQDPPSGAE